MRRLSVFSRKSNLDRTSGSSESSRTPSDLSNFLMLQKVNYLKAAEQEQARQWTVVMGNEAGDLDSLASSIAYAWYATKARRTLTIPLIQAYRADLVLRAENLYALSQAGIDPTKDLLCLDDLPSFPTDKFALVDHNRLGSQFSASSPEARVVAVIDHHEDEGLYKDTADPRIITVPTGSCSSLVTSLLTQHTPDSIPPELATLLLSAILIDTNGLKAGGKAEAHDREAVSFLLPHAPIQQSSLQSPKQSGFSFPSPTSSSSKASSPISSDHSDSPVQEMSSIQELTNVLMAKKTSVAHLSTRDLLRRDYKEYTWKPSWSPPASAASSSSKTSTSDVASPSSSSSLHPANSSNTSNTSTTTPAVQIGLATVPRGLKDWLPNDPEFWSASQSYLDERNLSALGILTTFRGKGGKGKHKREMLWLVKDGESELKDRLWKGLEESKDLKVKVKEVKKYAGTGTGTGAGAGGSVCAGATGTGRKDGAEKVAGRVRIYKQGNADATRKVTAPIVRTIVEGSQNGAAGGKL